MTNRQTDVFNYKHIQARMYIGTKSLHQTIRLLLLIPLVGLSVSLVPRYFRRQFSSILFKYWTYNLLRNRPIKLKINWIYTTYKKLDICHGVIIAKKERDPIVLNVTQNAYSNWANDACVCLETKIKSGVFYFLQTPGNNFHFSSDICRHRLIAS